MTQHQYRHLSSQGIVKYTALVVILLFGGILGLRGQDRPEVWSVIGVSEDDTLNVRSGPGERFSIVARLRNGTSDIQVDGQIIMNGTDDWIPIVVSTTRGWVRPKFLSLRDDAIALNTGVPVRRASIVEADQKPSDESSTTTNTVPSVSNNNDALWLGIFALLAGAIIVDELSGGDSISQHEPPFQHGYTPAEAEYDRQKYQRRENEIATSREDPLPYLNAPR